MSNEEITAPVLGGTNHGATFTSRHRVANLPRKEKTSTRFDPGDGHSIGRHFYSAEVYRLETFRTGRLHYGTPVDVIAWVPVNMTGEEALVLAKAHFGWDE